VCRELSTRTKMVSYIEFLSVVFIAGKCVCPLHTGTKERVLTGSFPDTV
jgi:hypothetical protein